MLKSLQLSAVGRLSLALAVFLALLAAASLVAARSSGARSAGASRLPGIDAGTVMAQGIPPGTGQQVGMNGILVYGDGEATASPDVAYVTLGVDATGGTAREALDKNSTAMAAVIDAVKRAGIPDKNLRTVGIALNPIMSQPKPGDQTPPTVTGYRASNSLSVTIDDTSKVGEVLDVAVGAGANVAGGIRFDIKDQNALRQNALEGAVRAARGKADTLAGALGVRITGVQSVAEQDTGNQGPRPLQAEARAASGSFAPPVQAGELTLRVRVQVVYTFG